MLYFSKWKAGIVAGICVLGVLLSLPNLFLRGGTAELPSWLPLRTVNLGLDLQGGAHLLIQVKTDAVVHDRLQAVEDSVRAALRPARIGYTNLTIRGNAVSLTLRDPSQTEEAVRLIREGDRSLTVQSGDNGQLTLPISDRDLSETRAKAVTQTIEIVRRRIDETGTREPIIQREGADRIIVQLPGVGDPERIKSLIKQTAKLTFHLLDMSVTPQEAKAGHVPIGAELLPSDDPRQGPDGYVVQKRVMLQGDRLVDAEATFQDGRPVVSFRFDTLGARRFGQVTQENVGKPFAIVLDNKVISAPVIREPILGGSGIISGSFTTAEAADLALLLRAGALPAPITYLEERTVGPGLGQDSIDAGKLACAIGFVAVVIFMVIAYGGFGVIADIALVFNLALLIAALSVLQATLTLPGIAGIVLTMGMAVDANVLIYERIREELDNGRSPLSAIEAGFERAQATIIDSNLTTLLAGLLLFTVGSGPVKGFAVTLSVGIVTTVFTAVMVTRLMVSMWLRRKRPARINI